VAAGTINKLAAVRQALQELGNDAASSDIQGLLRRKFGLELSTRHIAAYRSGALKKAQAARKATPASPAPAGAGPTKLDAVRRALAALGKGASREQVQAFVRDKFGYEMSTNHISNCKTKLARKRGKKGAEKEAPAPPAPARERRPAMRIDDVVAVQNLVGRMGPERLRTLIDVFAG
jgi:hypothetical protein